MYPSRKDEPLITIAMPHSLLVLVVCAVALCTVLCSDPVVSVEQGRLLGLEDIKSGRTVHSFLGVPFAAPPVGSLRWEPPQPPSAWSSIRNAQHFGADCYQPPQSSEVKLSEDCLFLNVYAPPVQENKTFPMMMFFYGGSWEFGGSSIPIYDGDYDVLFTQDVILVTVNYRLGAFGFLASPQLKEQTQSHTTGNFGILDQQAAMRWIQTNGAAFGGDPTRLTIFGESAGASSVSSHLVIPSSWPLFSAAIMESGPPASWTDISLDEGQRRFLHVCSNLQCSPNTTDWLECLRNKSAKEVQDASHGFEAFVRWTPVVDGTLLHDHADILLRQGKWAKVPVIMGTNLNEGSLFTGLKPDATLADYKAYADGRFGPTLAPVVLQQYPPSLYGNSSFWASADALTDFTMRCPTRRAASIMAESQNVFIYELRRPLDFVVDLDPNLGVFHGNDIFYIFRLSLFLNEQETVLSDGMIEAWTTFARQQVPSRQWSPFRVKGTLLQPDDTHSGDIMAFNVPSQMVRNDTLPRCALWDTFW
jgi:carboxylesterase type B